MPRTSRADAPHEIHHVWVRGLERRAIFFDTDDRLDLLERWSTVFPESGIRCLAWALLPNHYHLVVKRGAVPLSRVMARVNTGYATRFNFRHDRAGFLFQNRFGSRIVEGDDELIAVVRYVVRNPVKHEVCEEAALADYPWASLSAVEGRRAPLAFESPSTTRAILSAREEPVPGSTRTGEGRGEPVPATAGLGELISAVCRRFEVDGDALVSRERGRALSEARATLCWLAVTRLGLPGAELARRLGMTRSGVSRAVRRGRALAREGGARTPSSQQVNQRPRF